MKFEGSRFFDTLNFAYTPKKIGDYNYTEPPGLYTGIATTGKGSTKSTDTSTLPKVTKKEESPEEKKARQLREAEERRKAFLAKNPEKAKKQSQQNFPEEYVKLSKNMQNLMQFFRNS